MSDPNTLLLRETGIARREDGSEALNVGPIVAALGFLTEGRGDDRGTDEQGTPLPDLLSLAFDVVKSIILGGRHADYFRQVKLAFDEHAEAEGQMSLALARQASVIRRPTELAPAELTPAELAPAEVELANGPELAQVGLELRARLQQLEEAVSQVAQELDALDLGKPARSRNKARRNSNKKKSKGNSRKPTPAPAKKPVRASAKPKAAKPKPSGKTKRKAAKRR